LHTKAGSYKETPTQLELFYARNELYAKDQGFDISLKERFQQLSQ